MKVENNGLLVGVIIGLIGFSVIALTLTPISNPQSTHATDVSNDLGYNLVNLSAYQDGTCTYFVTQDLPKSQTNMTINGWDCKTGKVLYSSFNASFVFNSLSTKCNANNGCLIHVKGYSDGNFKHSYNITKAIIIPDSGHFNVEGEGAEYTVLQIPTGYDNNMFQFSGTKTQDSFFNSFKNFQLVGNNKGTNNRGFVLNGTSFGVVDSIFYNLFLRNFKQDDIYINTPNCWNNKFESDTIELAGRAGIYLDGGISCQDTRIINSKFLYNNQFGFYSQDTQSTIMGSWFYKTNQTAIKLNGASSTVIEGNRFRDNGIQTTNTYADLWILGSSNSVVNNIFSGAEAGVNQPKYGILLDTFENRNTIVGNNFGTAFGTNPLFTQSTSQNTNLISSNVGYNPVGKVSSPFWTTGNTIIPTSGNSATPNNATDTTATNMPVFLTVSGGATVSCSLKDNNGNVMQSGLATLTQQLIPYGYKFNCSWHTVPTFTVWFQ